MKLHLVFLLLANLVPCRIFDAATRYGERYNLEPELLLAVAFVESSFNPKASKAGCHGLYGVRWSIWEKPLALDHARRFEIDHNTEAGARVLAHYRDLAGGDIWKAVHWYNNGPSGKYNNRKYVPRVKAVYARIKYCSGPTTGMHETMIKEALK